MANSQCNLHNVWDIIKSKDKNIHVHNQICIRKHRQVCYPRSMIKVLQNSWISFETKKLTQSKKTGRTIPSLQVNYQATSRTAPLPFWLFSIVSTEAGIITLPSDSLHVSKSTKKNLHCLKLTSSPLAFSKGKILTDMHEVSTLNKPWRKIRVI